MLKITVPATEIFDENINEFVSIKETNLQLEHSLVSISKWESKWHKPFLIKDEKTNEEFIDYVRCMTLTQNVNPSVYSFLTVDNIDAIAKYIEDPMTATTFSNFNKPKESRRKEIITSEVIYYQMVAFGINFECQKWHLNRLLTLIRICQIKNQPPSKMKRSELIARHQAINAANKAKYNTRG